MACPSDVHGTQEFTLLGNEYIIIGKHTVNIKNESLHRLHFIEYMYQLDIDLFIGPEFGNLVLGQPEVCYLLLALHS
jgi:hypothetical protein